MLQCVLVSKLMSTSMLELLRCLFNAVDTCPSLSNPENGLVNVSGEVLGSTATYTCNNGYVLSGADLRFCLLGGVWSENDPTCISEYIEPPI